MARQNRHPSPEQNLPSLKHLGHIIQQMPSTNYPPRRIRYRRRHHPSRVCLLDPHRWCNTNHPRGIGCSSQRTDTLRRLHQLQTPCAWHLSTQMPLLKDRNPSQQARCTHCHTKQKYAECPHRHTATLLLSSPTAPDSFLRVHAYSPCLYDSVLRDITQTEDSSALITDDFLLSCTSFTPVLSPERQQLVAITRD